MHLEALIYQAIANENPIIEKSKAYIVRSYSPTDFKHIERVTANSADEYYTKYIESYCPC